MSEQTRVTDAIVAVELKTVEPPPDPPAIEPPPAEPPTTPTQTAQDATLAHTGADPPPVR